ncbi:MAG: autotransporter domain-containing protein [Xanthomonadaceae bacterium]|jgi:outer membrane lipase/esterase|nr:autotransporter domain-containing protein [Xanthomonadaceae bacterium]MDE2248137.1 autotransporter domain-containing protein [Xanthomonadaceae bacterium]
MQRSRILAGAIAATLLLSTAAGATQFSKVVIIGDSLSDAGNLSLALYPAIQPPDRFTTNPGLTAPEMVANGLGLPVTASLLGGTDYAFGGAGLVNNSAAGPIPTLPQQLQMYLAANGGVADSHALYQVWGGANDIFYLTATSTNPNVLAAGTLAAAQTELGLIGSLQAAGARYAVVYNLPDIGKTPSGMAGGAAASAGATQLSALYNGELNIGLNQLSAKGMNIIPVNSFALVNEVIANPAAYGFTNVTTPACGATASSLLCGPAGSGLPYSYAAGTDQTYLFADGVHPTQGADRLLAQAVLSEIAAPGQTSLLSQAPLTAITTQTQTVRGEMLNDGSGSGTRMFAHVNYSQQSFDLSSTSPKANSNNFNLTVGGDLRYDANVSIGAALGVGHSNTGVVGGTGGYTMQDISALAYITYHAGGAYLGAYGEAGHAHFTNVDRIIRIGPMKRTESGNTGGAHGGLGVTGGWWFGEKTLQYGPYANVEWHDIGVSSFQESGNDSTAMWFANQNRKALISTLGWRMQGQFQIANATLKPYAEVSWNHDSKADPSEVTAGLTSMSGSFTLTGYVPDRTWGAASIGLTTQLTPTVSSWVGYTGRFSDSSQRYNNINMGFKILL